MKAADIFITIDRVFAYIVTARAVIAGAEGAIQRLLTIAKSATAENRTELTEGEINVLTVARNQAIRNAERALDELKAQAKALGIPDDDVPPDDASDVPVRVDDDLDLP